MLYGSKCWTIEKQHIHKINVVEMRIQRWMSVKTIKDRIRN